MPKVSREAILGVSFEPVARLLADRASEMLCSEPAIFCVDAFGLEIAHEVRVVSGDLVTVDRPIELAVLPVTIEANHGSGFFPVLDAEIEVISTADCGVSVALEGEYRPPGGVVGEVADRAGLRRLADQVIDRFFGALEARLRHEGAALDALSGVPV